MTTESMSLIAGLISSFIFVSSHFPMLWKAYKTEDMRSYSWLNIFLANVGNLIYWLYIISLPLGPIWLLHTFYTVTSILMLAMYLRFRRSRSAR
jgi:hypothetical protein